MRLATRATLSLGQKTKLLVAALLAAQFTLPALAADEFYVVQDSRTRKCTIVDKKPTEPRPRSSAPSQGEQEQGAASRSERTGQPGEAAAVVVSTPDQAAAAPDRTRRSSAGTISR
jgi:hypothetical protein